MSGYISRDAAVNGLAKIVNESDMPEEWNKGMSAAMSALYRIPAADVQTVVLCRDCVMYECHEYDGGLKYVCRLFKRQMQETDFCSYGEKREES